MGRNIPCKYVTKYWMCDHPMRSKWLWIFRRQCNYFDLAGCGKDCNLREMGPRPPMPRPQPIGRLDGYQPDKGELDSSNPPKGGSGVSLKAGGVEMTEERFWKDYPELNGKIRTAEEDKLVEDILTVYGRIHRYLRDRGYENLLADLQGGIHLLQGIFITIQKRRLNR